MRYVVENAPAARRSASRCDYCVTRCPTGALAFHHHEVILAPERCTGCGICLFVCPADALKYLSPLMRRHRDGVLLGPFTLPVAAEELMLWHTHYAIRAVAVDLTQHPHWLRPLAELNLWRKGFDFHYSQIQSRGGTVIRRVRDRLMTAPLSPVDSAAHSVKHRAY